MKNYLTLLVLVVCVIIIGPGCSVGVTGQGDLKSQRQLERERAIAMEQENLIAQRNIEAEQREREAEERAVTRMILLQQQEYRTVQSRGPVTRFTEVRIKADADGPGHEPYAVRCGQTIRLDGTNSESDAGIPNIQWFITRGSLKRETSLTPSYTAPPCPTNMPLGGLEETDVTLIIEDPFGNRSSHTSCITIMYPYEPAVIGERSISTSQHREIAGYSGPQNVVPSTPCFMTDATGRRVETECPPQNVVISPIRETPLPPEPVYTEEIAPQKPTCMSATYLKQLTNYLTALGYSEFQTCMWLSETPSWMTADIYYPNSNVIIMEAHRVEEINKFGSLGYTVFPVSYNMIDAEIAKASQEIFLFIQENVKRPLLNERGL